ncbi:MAG TPA: response regulator [Solirubrobacteraceae bacterium]|nr:response regulator [Solirubrobacteraceae bacterium]
MSPVEPQSYPPADAVLLCEDNDHVRMLIERILIDAGYEVLSSAHPRDALELGSLHADRIALVVTDVILPGMSGLEFVGRVRGELASVPTLFLSGYSAKAVSDFGDLPGNSEFLQKPFDQEALLAKVAALRGD